MSKREVKLEERLWFVGLVSLFSACTAGFLIGSAGLPRPADMNVSQACPGRPT